jgi:hypothetical protein
MVSGRCFFGLFSINVVSFLRNVVLCISFKWWDEALTSCSGIRVWARKKGREALAFGFLEYEHSSFPDVPSRNGCGSDFRFDIGRAAYLREIEIRLVKAGLPGQRAPEATVEADQGVTKLIT